VDWVQETSYTSVDDAQVAYQIVGDGDRDLVWFWGLGNLDLQWMYEPMARALTRLASYGRLILFDRRGTGLSDPVPRDHLPTWEEWADDISAVLDAAGSEQAALYAAGDGGPIGVLFAALHPERVTALVLENTTARYLLDEDHPIGIELEHIETLARGMARVWGTDRFVPAAFPDLADDEDFVRWGTVLTRGAMTPVNAAAQYLYLLRDMDVRAALGMVQSPTLVLHHRDQGLPDIAHARQLADVIPRATLTELTGPRSPVPSPEVVESVLEWLTGERQAPGADRFLTTVLFTDIVSSTITAGRLGDNRWRELLDEHDRLVERAVNRHRGRSIKSTGDGVLACFDGPSNAVRCGAEITHAVRQLGIEARAGVHTGECERRGADVAGIAVHVAARVVDLAGAGQVLATSTVGDLVAGADLRFEAWGSRELKGLPGSWQILAFVPGTEHHQS
jgi:class 3 adenylate cyclase